MYRLATVHNVTLQSADRQRDGELVMMSGELLSQ